MARGNAVTMHAFGVTDVNVNLYMSGLGRRGSVGRSGGGTEDGVCGGRGGERATRLVAAEMCCTRDVLLRVAVEERVTIEAWTLVEKMFNVVSELNGACSPVGEERQPEICCLVCM